MSGPLRSAFTVLVLLNLVFVQLTDAVGLHWMLPMQLLAGCSPLFVRLQDRAWWRGIWNCGVIAILGILVHDTATTGPRHLLEDGLILAAFCQVHLLNVLRREQKPDLLFFNSFLIALVTSFFCQDLAFSSTFMVYAFVFVAALELAADHGRRPAVVVVRASVPRALTLVTVTALIFAFAPRDFRRDGLVGDTALANLVSSSTSGFRDRIDLTRSAHTTVSERVVMRVRPIDGDRAAVPSLWRGAALEWYDARGWRMLTRPRNDDPTSLPWRASGPGRWNRDGEARVQVLVECDDGAARGLFAPLEAVAVGVPADASPEIVYARADGTFARRPASGVRPAAWSYSVAIGQAARTVGRAGRKSLRPFLHLDAVDLQLVPPELHDLLQDALRGVDRTTPQAEVAERCRALLEGRFDYLLPGRQGSASDLAAFVAGEGGGHCELFATALAVMLRLHSVPCRVATGYLIDEWDPAQGVFIVRQRHAHAWVEVYDAERQVWHALDATPPAAAEASGGTGIVDALTAPFRELWKRVTTFDAEARRALVADLLALPSRLARASARHPLVALTMVTGAAALVLALLRRRRRRARDPVVAYQRAVRRLRLRRELHETPRELLDRARQTPGLPEEAIAALERATHEHENARFGATSTDATPRISTT